jgi:hypothetical protein
MHNLTVAFYFTLVYFESGFCATSQWHFSLLKCTSKVAICTTARWPFRLLQSTSSDFLRDVSRWPLKQFNGGLSSIF